MRDPPGSSVNAAAGQIQLCNPTKVTVSFPHLTDFAPILGDDVRSKMTASRQDLPLPLWKFRVSVEI